MPNKTRISVTIEQALVDAADVRARDLRRSRSWVVGEAVRAYAGGPTPTGDETPLTGPTPESGAGLEPEARSEWPGGSEARGPASDVTTAPRPPEATDGRRQAETEPSQARPEGSQPETRRAPAEADRAQLQADLALTAERRVLEAELSARLTELRSGRHRLSYVVVFESYEDYLDWKGKDEAGIP